MEDRQIAQLSGHKNLKSLDSYDEMSIAQQQQFSRVLTKRAAPGPSDNPPLSFDTALASNETSPIAKRQAEHHEIFDLDFRPSTYHELKCNN